MALMGIAKFERFFRLAAGLDVDKSDLKRYSDFVNQKISGGSESKRPRHHRALRSADHQGAAGAHPRVREYRRADRAKADHRLFGCATAARSGLQRRNRSTTSRASGWDQRRARPHLQDHRSGAEKPAKRALGALAAYLRPAAVDTCTPAFRGGREVRRRATDPPAANARAGAPTACAPWPIRICSALRSRSADHTRTNKTSSRVIS